MCDNVIYVPGNHDHQIWHLAMENDYKLHLAKSGKEDPMPEIVALTSPVYEGDLPSTFLHAFMKKIDAIGTELKIFYHNILLHAPTPDSPFVLFHYGHFAEDTYHAITKMMQSLYPELMNPDTLEELKHQNGAWINFAFSQLGRAGEAGDYFEQLMAILSSEQKMENIKDVLADNIAESHDFTYLPFHWMEKLLSKKLLTSVADQVRIERYKVGTSCSDKTMQNLMHYFDKFCYKTLKDHGWDTNKLHCVWSHTHKPYAKNTTSEIFGNLKITNTGGSDRSTHRKPKTWCFNNTY